MGYIEEFQRRKRPLPKTDALFDMSRIHLHVRLVDDSFPIGERWGIVVAKTDEVTSDCAKRVVNGVDFLARRFDLRADPVDLETKIGNLGLGDNDCAIFERYINKQRKLAGRAKLKSGTIKPDNSIQGLIDHAC